MKRLLLTTLLLLIAMAGFAQTNKDTIVYNLPMVDGKLVYSGNVNLSGRNSTMLDSKAKNWFNGYFKYHRPDTSAEAKTITNSVSDLGVLVYHVKPGLINIPYYAVITIHIICKDNNYSYKIYNIHFGPKNGFLNEIGFENDPEYLIGLYKQKHIGLIKSMSIDRSMIRNYLSNMNLAVRQCIASLNNAMIN